ncbi:hypothetical protein [Actinomycetospora sp.]|jgi:hypothetical protein|uniref:hypothetical protein n=1 Tax=Actinomycetospora sp. TaxID=1872135 RepID=UPI002F4039BF
MMAAEHRRNSDGSDDSDGRTPSLPETEHRTREEEAEADGGKHSGSPSLPEAERRAREAEARDD